MKKLLFLFIAIILLFAGKAFSQAQFFPYGEVSGSSGSWPSTPATEGCFFGRDSGGIVGCYNSYDLIDTIKILNSVDTTKTMRFDASNLTTGEDRVYYGADRDIDLGNMAAININWTDVNQIARIEGAGINFIDLQELNGAGRGGYIFAKTYQITIDNPSLGYSKLFQNLTGMTFTITGVKFTSKNADAQGNLLRNGGDTAGGINFPDYTVLEPINSGVYFGQMNGVNWYDESQLEIASVNWATIENLAVVGVNWVDITNVQQANITIQGYYKGAGN